MRFCEPSEALGVPKSGGYAGSIAVEWTGRAGLGWVGWLWVSQGAGQGGYHSEPATV